MLALVGSIVPNEHHRDFPGQSHSNSHGILLGCTIICFDPLMMSIISISLKKQGKGSSKTNPGVMMNYQPKLHALEKSLKLPIELHHFCFPSKWVEHLMIPKIFQRLNKNSLAQNRIKISQNPKKVTYSWQFWQYVTFCWDGETKITGFLRPPTRGRKGT